MTGVEQCLRSCGSEFQMWGPNYQSTKKLWIPEGSQPYHYRHLDVKILHTLIGMGSAALASAVPYPSKVAWISRKGLMKYWQKKQKLPLFYHSNSVSSFKSSLKTFLILKTFSSVSLPWCDWLCVRVYVRARLRACASLCVRGVHVVRVQFWQHVFVKNV